MGILALGQISDATDDTTTTAGPVAIMFKLPVKSKTELPKICDVEGDHGLNKKIQAAGAAVKPTAVTIEKVECTQMVGSAEENTCTFM